MNWSSIFWGRPIVVLVTVGLTVLGLMGRQDRPWFWILVFAAFIIVHESVNWWGEQRSTRRLGRNYQVIHERVLCLLADLADLTAGGFDLWMIDVYLPSHTIAVFNRLLNVPRLDRSLKVALTDVRTVPLEIEIDHELFGVCFAENKKKLWWDIDLADNSAENVWHDISEKVNCELRSTYGVISVNPIVDRLGKNCRGLIVVHAKPDSEIVTKVVGALREVEGKRRLDAACQGIHNLMGMASLGDT